MTRDASLHVPAGAGAEDGWDLVVTPESAGWTFAGVRTLTLPAGGTRELPTAGVETIVVPLQGAAVVVAGGEQHPLGHRPDVFAGAPDVVYLPPGTKAALHSPDGGRYALATAVTDDSSHPVVRIAAADVPVERRGAGQSSRLVRNFGVPDVLGAARIIACEVVTPAGNWSSYPAHKHDEAGPTESELEEIYLYEIAAGPDGQPGFGFHRTSSSPGHPIDVLVEVHDRDVALVPHGWHGPTVAAPGHDMWYLNVMAGPGARQWLITDHPEQTWVRGTWADEAVDPRLLDGRFGC